ncbi:MAG: helix-turn-helix domain-containing protein [Pseudomonadota bacterium]
MSESNNPKQRSRNRSQTEARLLDAAEKVFAQHGYDGASVRDVAAEAEANTSLINRYFGSKDGLLLGITERFIETKRHADMPYPLQPTLTDEIYHYLHHRLVEDRAQEAMVRLMVSRVSIDDDYRQRAQTMMASGADENFKLRIKQHQAMGSAPDDINIDMLFSAIAYFSFSVNFFGAIVERRPNEEIDAQFSEFAHRMGAVRR